MKLFLEVVLCWVLVFFFSFLIVGNCIELLHVNLRGTAIVSKMFCMWLARTTRTEESSAKKFIKAGWWNALQSAVHLGLLIPLY